MQKILEEIYAKKVGRKGLKIGFFDSKRQLSIDLYHCQQKDLQFFEEILEIPKSCKCLLELFRFS